MAQAKVYQNLVGKTTRGKFTAIQGAEWSCNMYREKSGDASYMASVPGLKFVANLDANGNACRGSYVSTRGLDSDEDLFVAYGDTLYRVYGNGSHATNIGTLANNTAKVCFAETGGERPLLLVADGTNIWYYDLVNGGTASRITLPNRISDNTPITPTHVAVVSGSIVVNDTGSGYVYYSKPYPLSQATRTMFKMSGGSPVYDEDGVTILTETVNSDTVVFLDDYYVQQYFNGESSSDKVNAVYAVGSALYLFGPKSVETWQRGSGDYQTWLRTSYTINSANGLASPYSLANINERVFYVGSGESFSRGVMMITGTTFKKISDQWLDEKLASEDVGYIFGFCYCVEEHQFYVLQLPTANETWVYDAFLGEWHQRESRVYPTKKETMWRVESIAYIGGHFYAFTSDGNANLFDGDYWYEDYSASEKLPMIRHRQTSVIVDNYKKFVLEELAIECNVGTWDDYSLQPTLSLRVSKDGGNTFGNIHSARMGRTGDYSHRVRFLALGLNRLCVIRVTYSHPTELLLSACEVRATSTDRVI